MNRGKCMENANIQGGSLLDNKGEKTLTGYPHLDRPWLKYYDNEF